MLIKLPAKTKYFFNFVLPFAILFQWALPTIENQIYINTNFGDSIYDKCNDPEHSHPPLSQRETSESPKKFVNLDLNNSFFVNGYQKYFDISAENIFEKPETSLELLFKHFPPARSPPYLEV